MSKAKKSTPPAPSTTIHITLNPDGSGTLLTKRGDMAALNSFSFKTMDDIITSMKQGAAHLMEFESNPPPKDFTIAQSSASALTEEIQEDTAPDETATEVQAMPLLNTVSTANGEPLDGVTNAATDSQLTLF